MSRAAPSAVHVALGSIVLAVVVAVLAAVLGPAAPVVPVVVQPRPVGPADPVSSDEAARYSGVAQVAEDSSCTAALLDTGRVEGPAYMITNGHCAAARDTDANDVSLDRPGVGVARFGMIIGAGPDHPVVEVPVKTVLYSSMKGTDVSVLELGATLGSLQQQGIRAYALAAERPAVGARVTNVGVPTTGVDPAAVGLRQGSCTVGASADLVEFRWLFDDVISNDCPGILGGSSGSPLLDDQDRIVGMINTTTGGAPGPGGECYLGVPCERTPTGIRVVPDRSYAVPVDGLSRCFPEGRFDLAADCPLPRLGVITRTGRADFSSRSLAGGANPVSVPVISAEATAVRVGLVPLTDADACAASSTYTATATATASGEPGFALALPSTAGRYLVCIAVDDQLAEAARVVFSVDDTPPVRVPTLSVQNSDDGYLVEPIFSVPELSDYQLKVGPATGTDCADPDGYLRYRRVPVAVEQDALPAVVCVIGYDLADNASTPTRTELPVR